MNGPGAGRPLEIRGTDATRRDQTLLGRRSGSANSLNGPDRQGSLAGYKTPGDGRPLRHYISLGRPWPLRALALPLMGTPFAGTGAGKISSVRPAMPFLPANSTHYWRSPSDGAPVLIGMGFTPFRGGLRSVHVGSCGSAGRRQVSTSSEAVFVTFAASRTSATCR